MDRSFSRIAALIGTAGVAGVLLAGCGSSAPGDAVIGAPPPAVSAPVHQSGDVLVGLQQAIADELAAVNSTQSDGESPQLLIELNALNSVSSLVRAETYDRLVAEGGTQTSKREQIVQGLIAQVQGDAYLKGVTVGGSSLSRTLAARLESVIAQLQSFANAISSAGVPDIVRSDILAINTSTRVYGLVEPMVHLALAGGDELSEVNTLAVKEQQLSGEVALGAGIDSRYAIEVSLLHDLSARLATARQAATAQITAVLSLTPSGFPGNKATIAAAHAQLSGLRSANGTLSAAMADANQIETYLGQRV